MRVIKLICVLINAIVMLDSVSGQTLHFSQAFYSPLNLNPALTGIIDANWRLVSNVRTQGSYYSQPLNTIGLSFDKYIEFQKGKLGLGVLYNHDSSFGLTIPSDHFHISGSGVTRISEHSYASAGMQVGLVWRRISYNGLSFPEQYDRHSGEYNPNLPLSEDFDKDSEIYPDINAGMLWWRIKKSTKIMSGISINHINNPNDSFSEKSNKVGVRTNVHGSLEYLFSDNWYTQSQVYYSHQSSSGELLFGASVGIRSKFKNINQLRGISLGIYFRNTLYKNMESAIVVVGTNFYNWTAFLSTDFDVSGLKTQSMFNNAIELSLIYHRPFAILQKFTLPCLRY